MALSSGRRAIRGVSPEGVGKEEFGRWGQDGWHFGWRKWGESVVFGVEIAGSGVGQPGCMFQSGHFLAVGNLSLCFSTVRRIIIAISSNIVRKSYDNVHQVLRAALAWQCSASDLNTGRRGPEKDGAAGPQGAGTQTADPWSWGCARTEA